MRSTIFIFNFFLITNICFCQQDITNIRLGNKIILLPVPQNDMAELGDSLRKIAEIQVPPNNLLKAVFLPIDVIKKIGKEPVSDQKKVLIEIVNSLEQKDVTERDFIDGVNYIKKSFPSDLPEVTKKANQLFKNMKDRIGKTEIGKMEILGTILDSKNSFAYLVAANYSENNQSRIIYEGFLVFRVKDRMIFAYFINYAESEEAIDWISNIIPIWCKKVFDLNPDIDLSSNREISNSSQQISKRNEITSNHRSTNSISDLFNSLYNLFKTLILKTPLTFLSLIILILLYYYGSRKLYYKFIRKPAQPGEYVKHVKSKSSKDNNILWLFLRLGEFIIAIVLLLSLLKLIGFEVPSEIM
jgi:hypothetical protein